MTEASSEKPIAVQEIERFGFTWTLVAEFDLTRLDLARRVQVRDSTHYAPKHMVERFAVQMGETAFPPIVITSDDWLVDGNTRTEARMKRGDRFCPAYVIDIEVGNKRTTAKDKLNLTALAATLNSNGGQPLDKNEARASVRAMIQLHWKLDEIARVLGITSNTVTLVRAELAAEDKLGRVGLGTGTTLRPASLRALGKAPVLALNDVPFKELAELTADAGLNAQEVLDVAKEAKGTGSDAGALEVIRTLRSSSDKRILEHRRTGGGKPPLARQIKQHLGFITKFEASQAEDLVESSEVAAAEYLSELRKAVEVLSAVLRLQESEDVAA